MVYTIESIKSRAFRTLEKYGVKRADIFGSYADGTAKDNSDIDLLVEFRTQSISLFVISQLKDELEENLGKSIDIIHGPLSEDAMIVTTKVVSIYEQ